MEIFEFGRIGSRSFEPVRHSNEEGRVSDVAATCVNGKGPVDVDEFDLRVR